MNDFPSEREYIGPAIIQQMQRDLNNLADKVRTLEPRDSATVHVKQDGMGTTWEVIPPTPSAPSNRRNTWG